MVKKKFKNNGLNLIDMEKGDLKICNEISLMYLVNIIE